MSTPFLSIIIPAHNEEQRLPATLEQVNAFLQSQPYSAEILVVENASTDGTLRIARELCQQLQSKSAATRVNIQVLQEMRRGKGLAVKLGILAARGEYRFMCDADLSMPIAQITRFLPPTLEGVDIAIASREAPGAMRINEPAYRHLVGRIYNTLIRVLALPGLQDTQCGFKCFRGEVAQALFSRQTLAGWSFDVEILFLARQRGYSIVEIPIPWYFYANSKISVVNDSLRMALDILAIRLNWLRGVYDRPV